MSPTSCTSWYTSRPTRSRIGSSTRSTSGRGERLGRLARRRCAACDPTQALLSPHWPYARSDDPQPRAAERARRLITTPGPSCASESLPLKPVRLSSACEPSPCSGPANDPASIVARLPREPRAPPQPPAENRSAQPLGTHRSHPSQPGVPRCLSRRTRLLVHRWRNPVPRWYLLAPEIRTSPAGKPIYMLTPCPQSREHRARGVASSRRRVAQRDRRGLSFMSEHGSEAAHGNPGRISIAIQTPNPGPDLPRAAPKGMPPTRRAALYRSAAHPKAGGRRFNPLSVAVDLAHAQSRV
jgi:hypothetical protein